MAAAWVAWPGVFSPRDAIAMRYISSLFLWFGLVFPNVVAFLHPQPWHHCPPTTLSGRIVHGQCPDRRVPLYAEAGSETESKRVANDDDSNDSGLSNAGNTSVFYFVESESELPKSEDSPATTDVPDVESSGTILTPIPSSPPERSVMEKGEETEKKSDSTAAAIDLLESIGDAAISVTLDLLSALRWGAAAALTASLPEQQRNELLNRMSLKQEGIEVTKAVIEKENQIQVRGSVQEEIAAALVKESRTNEDKWEKEKENLVRQMEEASTARVKNELSVQKQRLEQEQQTVVEGIEAEKQKLEKEKMLLERAMDTGKEIEELESLLKKRELQQEALVSVEEDLKKRVADLELEKEKMSTVEAEIEKREQQQAALDAMEEDLRNRVVEIEAEKERILKLESEIVSVREKQDAFPVDATSQFPRLSPKEYRDLSNEEKLKLKEQRNLIRPISNRTSSTEIHPVLGPIISDLGYKRIHLVSSGKLGTVPVWNKNRIYRNDRARAMALGKMKSMHLGFPGVICVHEALDGKLSILDGQHRVGMMASMREKRNKDMEATGKVYEDDSMFDKVLVEVYPQRGESAEKHAEELFLEINKAEPVKL